MIEEILGRLTAAAIILLISYTLGPWGIFVAFVLVTAYWGWEEYRTRPLRLPLMVHR
jgi:hypothetical protein